MNRAPHFDDESKGFADLLQAGGDFTTKWLAHCWDVEVRISTAGMGHAEHTATIDTLSTMVFFNDYLTFFFFLFVLFVRLFEY